jgi:hypothetical protein
MTSTRGAGLWLAALLVVAGLVACGAPEAEPASPTPTPEPLAVGLCDDVTTSVPLEFAARVNAQVADQLDAWGRRPHGALVLHVRAINSRSYEPESLLLTVITVPELPRAPATTPPGNPFDAKCRDQSREQDREARARWEQRVRASESSASEAAERLRSLQLSPDPAGTELLGCPLKIAEAFPRSGVRRIVIASDLEPSGRQQADAQLDFNGVAITIVHWCRETARECQDRRTYWATLLGNAGAKVRFVDEAEELPRVLT